MNATAQNRRGRGRRWGIAIVVLALVLGAGYRSWSAAGASPTLRPNPMRMAIAYSVLESLSARTEPEREAPELLTAAWHLHRGDLGAAETALAELSEDDSALPTAGLLRRRVDEIREWEARSAPAESLPEPAADAPRVRIDTSQGAIVAALYPEAAPVASRRFLEACRAGTWDGAAFDRVVPGVLIQATPKGDGAVAPEAAETPANVRHFRHVLAAPRAAPGQLLITTAPAHHLDGESVVFGAVLEGGDVIARIETAADGDRARIESIEALVAGRAEPPALARETDLERGVRLLEANRNREAQAALELATAAAPDDPEPLYHLGFLHMNGMSDVDRAVDCLERAVELDAEDARFQCRLAGAYGLKAMVSDNILTQASLATKVKKHFELAVELDGELIEARTGLFQFYLFAPGFMGGGDEKAAEQARAIAELDPAQGHLAQAGLHEKARDVAAAEESYREAVRSDPENGKVYHGAGYFYVRQKRGRDAVERFRRYVELEPANPNSHDSLGDGYRIQRALADAIASFRRALELDPAYSASLGKLAECLAEQGDEDGAREAFEAYLAKVERGRTAERAREWLAEHPAQAGSD